MSTMNEPSRVNRMGALITIGICVGFATLFLLCGILMVVHEAIRVEAGKGDSWLFALSMICLWPPAVALGVCGALSVWERYKASC